MAKDFSRKLLSATLVVMWLVQGMKLKELRL